jgi:hypothetical protein
VAIELESHWSAERLPGGNSKPVPTKGYVLGRAGSAKETRVILEELMNRSRGRYVPHYALALVQAGLGERESVHDTLDAAYAARDVNVVFLTVDPKWDDYRSEPRFKQLLDRCRFMTAR